jgi:hypothetical protein
MRTTAKNARNIIPICMSPQNSSVVNELTLACTLESESPFKHSSGSSKLFGLLGYFLSPPAISYGGIL